MHKMEKLLVAIDFSEMDHKLIRYAKHLGYAVEASSIHFVHVIKDPSLPAELNEEYKKYLQPLDQQLKEQGESIVQEIFDQGDPHFEVHIRKGMPFREIMDYSDSEDVDLIIAGQKIESEGSGIIASRLARKAQTSILIVPEGIDYLPRTLFVPLDFSDYSALALQVVEMLEKKLQIDKIYFQHVYQIPIPSYEMMRTHSQMANYMKENAETAYQKYWAEHKPDIDEDKVEPVFTLDEYNNPAKHILESAIEHTADMIVIGSKGQNSWSAIFMGSVTEKLLKLNDGLPILVVKRKGENKGLLNMLMNE